MHRFYYPDSLASPEIELSGTEANHLARVLRLQAGEIVEVFDGAGQAVAATVVSVGKRSVRMRPSGTLISSPRLRPSIRLLVAAPKAERLRWLVEKCAELGVARLSLLETQRSVVHPGAGKLDKMHACVIAAGKQCGRNDLMQIDPPRPWRDVVSDIRKDSGAFLMATLQTPGIGAQLGSLRTAEHVTIAIGPEGDWTPEEIELAVDHGARCVGLGPLVLRLETAALAAVSAIVLSVCDESVTSD